MTQQEIYYQLQEIVKPIHAHSDQLLAISEYIKTNFKPLKDD